MASTYLSKTFSSDTTAGRRKWTWSAWVKRSTLGTASWLFHAWVNASNENSIFFDSSDRLSFSIYEGNNNNNGRLRSTRKFRDTNAWYHLQFVWDSANSTASDRMIIYVNNERLTAFDDNISGGSNHQTLINKSGTEHSIGRYGSGTYYFGGSISHVHFSDGYALAPTVFGEEDASTGEWKIKTDPSFTLGTNGFTILKDGNTITDQSTNSNNWTLGGGTLTKTEDCPSNVFATLNPLNVPTSNAPTFANGNTTSTSSTTNGSYKWGGCTTLGMTSGKFYCEAKATVDNTYSRNVIGITGDSANIARANGSILNGTHSWGYYSENGTVSGNGSGDLSGFNTTYTTGDIISMALDLDNNKLYFRKNNDAWQNSGDPTSGASGTGAVSIISASDTNDGAYFFAQTDDTGTDSPSKFEFNFGNGAFGSTQLTGTTYQANGLGIFKYQPPTGFTALSTKGLNL